MNGRNGARQAIGPLAVVAATAALAACTSLLDFDGYQYVDPAGGGAGGSTGQPCSGPEQCPGLDGQCQQRTCTQGTCGTELSPASTPCTEGGGSVCDGQGQCVECLGSDDCTTAGTYCEGVTCVAQKPVGASCTGPDQCQNAHCADGYCCATACDGPCDACDVSGSEGTCTLRAQGAVGDPTCAPYVCDGASAGCPTSCVDAAGCAPDSVCDATNHCTGPLPTGASCTLGDQCASGQCVDGYCCDGPCSALCQACSAAKTGATNGQCAFISVGTNPDADCGGFETCNGAGVCSLKSDGLSCGASAECANGNCIDGFCCNGVCGALCQACSAAKTGATNGQCAFVAVSTDPDDDCPGNQTCDGLGACTP
jgi:hypothetical protein